MASAKKRPSKTAGTSAVPAQCRDEATVRFAGDLGDGMHLAGAQFTSAAAADGNDVYTLLDVPAEVRAPAGALAGVSTFQVHFSKHRARTPGDSLDALIAMNPAALRMNLPDLAPGGVLVLNSDAFTADQVRRAGYDANPQDDGSLNPYHVLAVPIDALNRDAVAKIKLSPRETDRCRNFFALGLACWLFNKPLQPTLAWIAQKYPKNPAVLEANTRTLHAGYDHGKKSVPVGIEVPRADLPKGRYRTVTGTEALVLGLVTAAERARAQRDGLALVFAAAPSVPASEILHRLAELGQDGIHALQAEDEIAGLTMALGASFGGALGVTATSGPGMSLCAESLGLAVMAELPCVVVNVQRAGPSTGLPSKTEQADLLQALFGRHGECPLAVLAASSPADCFAAAYEAVRLALAYMTPVVLLSDSFLAGSAAAWRIPGIAELPELRVMPPRLSAQDPFLPYARDERLVRPWASPGTPRLEHRVGGLEKENETGNVSYDPMNHETLVKLRAAKIARIAQEIPPLELHGAMGGELLILGWGSTQGAIRTAVERMQAKGRRIACAHFRYLNPLPKNTGAVLSAFKKVLVAELNGGQLIRLLRDRFLVDAVGYNKIQGSPFLVREIEAEIRELVSD